MEKIRTAVRHPLAGKVLTLMAAISGLLLIPAGFFGFFTLTLNVLYFIVCLYILYAPRAPGEPRGRRCICTGGSR